MKLKPFVKICSFLKFNARLTIVKKHLRMAKTIVIREGFENIFNM